MCSLNVFTVAHIYTDFLPGSLSVLLFFYIVIAYIIDLKMADIGYS